MPNIVIQPGHINCKYNIDPYIRKLTGAPGEQEINKRIADRLTHILITRGFSVIQTDANANSDKSITENDFDLFLSLHCDADAKNDSGGGMIGSGDKNVDAAWKRSKEIADIIKGVYFEESGIVDKNFVTAGMTKYYMWKYLSEKTPCVLLEMGQAQDPHDKVLLANTDLIANAIARSIFKIFNLPYDISTNNENSEIESLKKQLDDQKNAYEQRILKLGSELADINVYCSMLKNRLDKISILANYAKSIE